MKVIEDSASNTAAADQLLLLHHFEIRLVGSVRRQLVFPLAGILIVAVQLSTPCGDKLESARWNYREHARANIEAISIKPLRIYDGAEQRNCAS